MPKKPNIITVAQAAGVSTATVSQVMRGAGRISEDTRRKVLDAARQVSYVPNARAAAMRSGESREVGLLIHKIANPFNAEVISGVSDLLEGEDYLVSVLDSRDDPDREFRNVETFIRNMRGGLIWVPSVEVTENTYALIETHNLPVVTFLRRSRDMALDHVSIENQRATEMATRYLIDQGHSKIAYLGGRRELDARLERIEGFRQVLASEKLGTPLIISCEDTKQAGFTIVSEILSKHPDVTALICNGDMVALGAMAGFQRKGLMPGKDISIIGFDDIPDAAISTPPLTTLAVQPYDLGRKLARVLLDRILQPDIPVSSVQVSADLVVRESTGLLPS